MLTTPRQIVLDKNAFLGIGLGSLCAFAKSHFLLLSDTLLYECTTATNQVPQDLLDRYKSLMKAGAYYCSMSRRFVEWECRHCRPYPWLLADPDETEGMCRGRINLKSLLSPRIANQTRDARWLAARKMLLDLSKDIKQQMDVKDPSLGKELRGFPEDRFTCLNKILDRVSPDFHDMATKSFPQWIRYPDRVCLSTEWMSWHLMRIHVAVIVDYMCYCEKGGPLGENRAEHDLHDIEYVLLLSRTDAIISKDKKLVEPLARAAFPQKDVFSSLEEVPDSYRCDWGSA